MKIWVEEIKLNEFQMYLETFNYKIASPIFFADIHEDIQEIINMSLESLLKKYKEIE